MKEIVTKFFEHFSDGEIDKAFAMVIRHFKTPGSV